ncbi:MAG TPA: hypothetical protein VGD40_13645 [Chryseosolibacter sp.]
MITHHCRIVNKTIIVDGVVLFHSDAASLDDFLLDAYKALKIDYPKFYKMDNLSKAGFLAAEMLLKKSPALKYAGEKISLVLANAHASLDTDMKYAQASQSVPSPALFVYTLANIVAGEICIRHKIKGENAFFVSETFDAALFESYVSMIPADHLCLAGWVDVMGKHHDVFLYLQDNASPGKPHRASTLNELYKKEYGTVNG